MNRGQFDPTVYLGAPVAEPTLLGLSSLEQAVVNVPDELLQLRVGRVHYLRPGFTQDPSGDPSLRGQGHDQEHHRADTEHRGHREGYPFPQRRHLTSPCCPEEGNTRPGSDRGAHSAITMSLLC